MFPSSDEGRMFPSSDEGPPLHSPYKTLYDSDIINSTSHYVHLLINTFPYVSSSLSLYYY